MEPILQVINTLKLKINLKYVKSILDLGCGSFYNRPQALVKEHDILSTVFKNKEITGIDIFDKDISWRKKIWSNRKLYLYEYIRF